MGKLLMAYIKKANHQLKDQYHNYLSRIFIIETPKFFTCSKCNYKSTRKYHTRMHFIRIHIKKGTPSHKKRKF